jgi:hypothetical protein
VEHAHGFSKASAELDSAKRSMVNSRVGLEHYNGDSTKHDSNHIDDYLEGRLVG